jgi:endonuclease-3 related protein
VIIGAILTQNTAWKNVEKAIRNLKREGVLTPRKLHQLPVTRLAQLIRPAGYFNVKAKRLKHFLDFFSGRYQGDVKRMRQVALPRLREELLGVNGIGEETADSILLYALGKRSFVIDAYTRRVFSRHRYLSGKESYAHIQKTFSGLLPKSEPLYNDYHAQIVEVGKDYCRKSPDCDHCPLKRFL